MERDEFDVIVVGAGMAGLCCAGELVLHGLRPLLVCESKEVGALYRPTWIGNNRGFMHQPTRQVSWGGGWWFQMARKLNIGVRMVPSYRDVRVMIRGSGVARDIMTVVSAAGMAGTIAQLFPIPIDDATRIEIERVFDAGLRIPHEELVKMGHVPLGEWLEDQKADPLTTMMFVGLGAGLAELSAETALSQMSVLGCLGSIRSYMCGEADIWAIFPDAREGLAMPIAREIERRGGAVSRGKRVAKVLTDGGRAGAVVFEDGTEASAPYVAIATGNPRIKSLFDPLPPEVHEVIAAEDALPQLTAYETLTLLDKPVDTDPYKFMLMANPDGSAAQATWSLQAVAPWTTEPGKFLMISEQTVSDERITEAGGDDAIYAEILELSEEMHPGFKDAVVEVANVRHPSWMAPFLITPKLSRTIESVENLWFVGEGSEPIGGIYVESSASAGILRARGIAAAR